MKQKQKMMLVYWKQGVNFNPKCFLVKYLIADISFIFFRFVPFGVVGGTGADPSGHRVKAHTPWTGLQSMAGQTDSHTHPGLWRKPENPEGTQAHTGRTCKLHTERPWSPARFEPRPSCCELWTEEVEKAEHELRVAQTEFDRQAEVTRLLLEGIGSTHVNHLRCLHEFVEAQAVFYKHCHHHMQELQKELSRFPNAFTLNSTHGAVPVATAASEGAGSPAEADTLKIEEVQAPATGTRKAKVLYDYDAADSSELSLLADELITVYTVPGMDSDWLVGERGNQRGKVPVTYLELLS